MNVTRIGLISDTHGVSDPAVLLHFAGVDCIIHAGDVGNHGGEQGVLDMLATVAPVTAVRGNVDDQPTCKLASHEVLLINNYKILVTHIVNGQGPDGIIPEAVALLENNSPVDVVIFGHSHKYEETWRGGTLFINPGSAGPSRFNLPRSIAILALQDKDERGGDNNDKPQVTHIVLGKAPPRPSNKKEKEATAAKRSQGKRKR